MSDDDEALAKLSDARLRAALLARLLHASRDMGGFHGRMTAYRDVTEEIAKALASAEEELARAPSSDLVMGEIIALQKLAAHFADATSHYRKRYEEYAEELTDSVSQLVDAISANDQP
jgi:hypothetical protein